MRVGVGVYEGGDEGKYWIKCIIITTFYPILEEILEKTHYYMRVGVGGNIEENILLYEEYIFSNIFTHPHPHKTYI
jgi:hypothetical protein